MLKTNQMGTVLARMKTYGKQSGEFKKTDAPSVTGLVRRDVPKKAGTSRARAAKKGTKKS